MILLLIGLFFSTAFANTNCTHDSQTLRCVEFIKNYDADTITVEIPGVHPLLGNKANIRVAHVDTPEIRTNDRCEKEAGRTAQRFIENVLKNAKRIDLKNVQRDKYFRILAQVEADGKDLASLLLKNGLAYPYEGGTKRKMNWCNRKIAGQNEILVK